MKQIRSLSLLILCVFFVTFLTSPANATLISKDFASSGDGLLTFDSDTGLEWLDLSETLDQSYNDIIGGYGGFTTTHSFRYASNAEVLDLIDNAGGDNPVGISNLLAMLGCTINCSGDNPGAFGIVSETGGLVEYSWFLNSGANSDVWVPGADGHLPETGSLLVRNAPVPEPATILLFGIGLLGIARLNRKKI